MANPKISMPSHNQSSDCSVSLALLSKEESETVLWEYSFIKEYGLPADQEPEESCRPTQETGYCNCQYQPPQSLKTNLMGLGNLDLGFSFKWPEKSEHVADIPLLLPVAETKVCCTAHHPEGSFPGARHCKPVGH